MVIYQLFFLILQKQKQKIKMKLLQSSIFRALCSIIVGVLLLKYPDNSVTWLTMAIGILFLLSGIIALISYWNARRHAGDYTITDADGNIISGTQPAFPLVGLGSVILGLTLVLSPDMFVKWLMYILGAMLILGSVNQLIVLVAARRYGSIGAFFWIAPVLIFIAGIFIFVKPMESAELPMIILGMVHAALWCHGDNQLYHGLQLTPTHQTSAGGSRKGTGSRGDCHGSERGTAPTTCGRSDRGGLSE